MFQWQRKPSDPAAVMERRLNRIERENEQSVKWDHRFAFLLILTIAAAALLGIASDAINALISGHVHGVDIVNLSVAFLFVLGMNRALLAAAREIRRHQSRREVVKAEDRQVMWGVALIESVSLGYMLWRFEQPHDLIQWVLIVARAGVIPYATIYLETRRQWPIDPQDISIQTEIASGIGALRDIVTIAHDRAVPTAYKVALYKASADLTPSQEAKLDNMIQAAAELQAYHARQAIQLVDKHGDPLPSLQQSTPVIVEEIAPAESEVHEHVALPKPAARAKRKVEAARVDMRHKAVFAALDAYPATSARELARQFGVSVATAQMDMRAWKAARQAAQQDAALQGEG